MQASIISTALHSRPSSHGFRYTISYAGGIPSNQRKPLQYCFQTIPRVYPFDPYPRSRREESAKTICTSGGAGVVISCSICAGPGLLLAAGGRGDSATNAITWGCARDWVRVLVIVRLTPVDSRQLFDNSIELSSRNGGKYRSLPIFRPPKPTRPTGFAVKQQNVFSIVSTQFLLVRLLFIDIKAQLIRHL